MVVTFDTYYYEHEACGVFPSIKEAKNFYLNFFKENLDSEEEFHKAMDLCKKAIKYQEFDDFGEIYYDEKIAKFLF